VIPGRSSPLQGSAVALGLTVLALLISLAIRGYLEPDIHILFLVAVWAGAWYSRWTGGFTAAAASSGFLLYFFFRPESVAGATPPWGMALRSVVFLGMSLLITWATSAWIDSKTLLTSTLASIGDAVVVTNRHGVVTFLNPVAETLAGWSCAHARGKRSSEVLHLIAEGTREAVEDPLARTLRERTMTGLDDHCLLVSRSGVEVPVEHVAAPVRSEEGKLRGAIVVFRDISKRRQLAEQSTHAEKMDAVGRLADGVAGDFNNVITMITGYADLLHAGIPQASPLRRYVDEIVHAGERAAALTRQLMAFSRGSTAQPRVLDLNSVITTMEPMLRRQMGQSIELILLTTRGLGPVRADPSQIEQVILNLAVNARDAMPSGGKLVIETTNADIEEGAESTNLGLKPGPYVMLAVSDTGIGMDAETRSRLFEPFFTTKAPGKGSGLGLSTVYGIVKQSDGQITVYSQPGCGTIFEVYLPRVTEVLVEPAPLPKTLAKGSETILLVDDEDGVRNLMVAVLQTNGYEVLEANNGANALAVYEKNAHKIDIVLTDIVMPQMNGIELGRALRTRAPGLKILYISGYRENPLLAHLGDNPRDFLQKPFTPDVLLGKVRDVLDSEASAL